MRSDRPIERELPVLNHTDNAAARSGKNSDLRTHKYAEVLKMLFRLLVCDDFYDFTD